MNKGNFDNEFEHKIYTGTVKLLDPQTLQTYIPDVSVEYSEETQEQKLAIDIIIANTLSEQNYIIYCLRKKHYTLEKIGEVFNLRKSSIFSRIKTIEKTINDILNKVNKYQDLQYQLQKYEKQINFDL